MQMPRVYRFQVREANNTISGLQTQLGAALAELEQQRATTDDIVADLQRQSQVPPVPLLLD